MRKNQTGTPALQETHSDDEQIRKLNENFPCYTIHHTSILDDENQNAHARKGVAIIINKNQLPLGGSTFTEIIPGRALLGEIPWRVNLTLNVLAIYAPPDPDENSEFWKQLIETLQEKEITRIDIMLGDMNFVEDSIDRWPHREVPQRATEAMLELRIRYSLDDGWRRRNPPPARANTYTQSANQGGGASRIDRIYCTDEIYEQSTRWEIARIDNIANLDHFAVSTTITDDKAPYIGPGRWRFPENLLYDKNLWREIDRLGHKLMQDIEQLEEMDTHLIQTFWKNFTSDIKQIAQKLDKIKKGKLRSAITSLERD
ncbi:hypothetical protein DL93DRAFT_2122660, partial [Clavulina sp. PMI_390]